jgi:arabinose-5-phosphate isomerase
MLKSLAENQDQQVLTLGRNVLRSEIEALDRVCHRLGDGFSAAVSAIQGCRGNVVLTGVGKPFFIAQKISASMASTGTPSIAIHPVDALHGDLGRIQEGDVVIALSNSGASKEIVEFVRAIRHVQVTRIAITALSSNLLGRLADIVIELGTLEEACPMGMAPSTTSTAMLAVGDALTLTLLQLSDFRVDEFARLHPGGSLGRRLRPVELAMRGLDATAVVHPGASVLETLNIISSKRAGAACIADEQGILIGLFTDGDLRRVLANSPDSLNDEITVHMTRSPKTIAVGENVDTAIEILRKHQIDDLPVIDETGRLVGHLDIQDIA